MPFHSPRNFCPGGFSCFRPGCNARLSSVICRLSSVVCRLSSVVCRLPTLPRRSVDPSIRRSVDPSVLSVRSLSCPPCPAGSVCLWPALSCLSGLRPTRLSCPVRRCLVLRGIFLSGIPWTQCRYGRITYFSAFLNCPMVSFAAIIPPGHASVHLRRRGKFQF